MRCMVMPVAAILTLLLITTPSINSAHSSLQQEFSIQSMGNILDIQVDNDTKLSRLHIERSYIKDEYGSTVFLRGVDIPHAVWSPTRHNKMTLQQFEYMRQWGINVVRIVWQQSYVVKYGDKNQDLARLDDMVLNWTEAKGIYAVISYHWGSVHVNDPDWEGWIAWKTFWTDMATRYNGTTHVMYDLMNEPYGVSAETYQTKMRDAIDTIRAIDPNVIIVLEAITENSWYDIALNYEQTHPINRDNVIFSPHKFYWNPNGATSKTSILNWAADKGLKWAHDNDRVVWTGEVNWDMRFMGQDYEDGKIWFRNYLEVMDEYGYNGYASWGWQTSTEDDKYYLLSDWNGNPSDMGSILQEHLLSTSS